MTTEPETIDGDATELLPAIPEPASPTLFRTDDPGEIVARATDVADQLSKVLRDRKLTSTISGKEHVRVEGWTLLGTMLGVFPVVEWTRPVEGGWEARVEARTLAGAVVGAAEAQCLRSEKTWKSRDDYALRSMAQTRATSKALRGPLGFVVSLAGFDPTPEEEMPHSTGAAPGTAADAAAPTIQLPESFPAGDDLGKRVGEALQFVDPSVDWRATWEDANDQCYGSARAKLPPREKAESLIRLANVADTLTQGGDFPPPTDDEIAQVFAACFDSIVVEVHRHEPAE